MLINLRNALMTVKRLPYDAEVEYLESTGTQYIDTGFAFNSATDVIEMVYMVADPTTSTYMWTTGSLESGKPYGISVNNNESRFTFITTKNGVAQDAQTTTRHKLEIDSRGIVNDGVIQKADSGTGINGTWTNYLFALHVTSGASYFTKARVYGYRHKRNGVLVRDYIPVRAGTVGYLYNRVSGQLFGNAGTGDFVLGPDVVPVEYIESHRTEYIDTLVNADSNLSVEITMANAGTPWANTNPTGAILVLTSSQTRHHLNFSSNGVKYFYGNISDANVDTRYKPANLIPFTFKVDSVNKIFTLGNYSTALPTYAFDAGLSYWLFGRNGTTPPYLGALRIYSAKLWNGSTLVRDYIPVRVGTEGAMMDVLTRRIYRNAGTGAFTYGNDLKYPIPSE